MKNSTLIMTIVALASLTFGLYLFSPQINAGSAGVFFLLIGITSLIIALMIEKRDVFEQSSKGRVPAYASKYPAFTESDIPFKGKARARSASYGRLVGRWIDVDVSYTWEKVRQELESAFREQYGYFITTSGKKVRRWTDETWGTVRRDICFEKKEEARGGPQPV